MINTNKENEQEIELKLKNISFHNDLKNNLSDNLIYEGLLKNIKIAYREDDTIFILCPERLKEYVKTHYTELIERTISNIYNEKLNIIFIKDIVEIDALAAIVKPTKKTPRQKSNVRKDLTFDTYAEGKFNSLVIKAARTICKNESVVFSPLFIYSGSGLGKTHLLHAIGNELIKNGKTCFYVNPDELTRRLVEQLRTRNQEEINKIVDDLVAYDCLMFDDVQQYANKESTLIVLFNIINHMFTNDKQVIISADKRPEDLGGFEQRFITRFTGGLTVKIDTPEIDDVIAILKFKLRQNNINPELWEDESLKFVARNFATSIRSIEGAINRIKLFSQNDDFFTYDMNTIRNVFKNMSQVKDTITPDKIIDMVAKYYKLEKNRITARTRKEEVVIARRISMWLIKNSFDCSFEEIGKMFGNQSHSNVIISVQWVDNNFKTNTALKVAINKIKENLNRVL